MERDDVRPLTRLIAHQVYKDGQSMSFEENRAAVMGYVGLHEEPNEDVLMPIFNSPAPTQKPHVQRPPSPTIHTKEAMQDIFQMFSTPLEPTTTQNEIVYRLEEDETITKKVYKRPTTNLKFGVYRDESDEEESKDVIGVTPHFQRSTHSVNMFGQPVHTMTPVSERTEQTLSSESMTFSAIHTVHTVSDVTTSGLECVEKIHLDGPCDPSDPTIRLLVLKRQQQKSTKDPRFHLFLDQKTCFAKEIRDQRLISLPGGKKIKWMQTLSDPESSSVVYLVQDVLARTVSVLKIQEPPTIWEYYILSQLWSHTSETKYFVRPLSCYMFSNESVLEMEHQPFGSLNDVLCQTSEGLEEILVAFWAWEILGILQVIHKANFVHGDIHLRNLHVRKAASLSEQFDPHGMNGWGDCGLTLLDWGAAIDVNAFDQGQTFEIPASHDPDSIASECVEFRNGGTWTFEPDFYAVACVLHLLIFGVELETNERTHSKPHLQCLRSFDSHWHPTLWKELFHVLLNTVDHARCSEVRMELQEFLVQHSVRLRLDQLLFKY
jgi:checkpoint serine/threonine-protein kinase